jgi:hypothetical protein
MSSPSGTSASISSIYGTLKKLVGLLVLGKDSKEASRFEAVIGKVEGYMYRVLLFIIARRRSLIPPWKRGVVVKEGEWGFVDAAVVHILCFWGMG